MTTGATAGECVRVMMKSGAKEVFVATVARATREVETARGQAVGFSGRAFSGGASLGGTRGHA